MTIAWVLLFGGFCLVVAGWKNVSFLEVLRGNFDVPKKGTGQCTSARRLPGAGCWCRCCCCS